MRPVLDPKEMAAAEQAAVVSGTSIYELMERAGSAVAHAAIGIAGGIYGKRFLVICGKGNNAGDGFVAARKVRDKGGYVVVVHPIDARDSPVSDESRVNLDLIRDIKRIAPRGQGFARALEECDVIVDALVGAGFRGTFTGAYAEVVEAINASGKPVVAVDVPSGVDATTGAVAGPSVDATLTVCMGALKAGAMIGRGASSAGRVVVADIGVPRESLASYVQLVEAVDVAALLPRRTTASHKRNVGKVLVVAGSSGMPGAAVLAARGALRCGAGLVRCAVPAPIAGIVSTGLSEALCVGLPATASGALGPSAVDQALELASQMDAVVLGPGVSRETETSEFVHKFASQCEKPLVLDADGISAFAEEPTTLKARRAPTLLTPHSGEMARLLGAKVEEVDPDRVAAVRRAASECGATVLLKGTDTLVAAPDGSIFLSNAGGPVLATGGTGDVLSGMAASLLAAGRSAQEAGWMASWIHGMAGARIARRQGDTGAVASDLFDEIPSVIFSLQQEVSA